MSKDRLSVAEHNDSSTTFDNGRTTVNQYATKKTLAVSNLEVALLVTNAIQLKTLLGNTTERNTLWGVGLGLVCASLILQVFNACILVVLGTDDLEKKARQRRLVSLNNFSLIISIFINVINIVLNVIVAVEPDIITQTLNKTKTSS